MARLEFSQFHSYDSRKSGVTLPVILRIGAATVMVTASVDTGAAHCLFERTHAEMLGLNVEAGRPMTFHTATGRVEAYGHTVELETLDLRFESEVYFFRDAAIQKNLLGRIGWLNRIRLGIVDYDSSLYLAPYDYQSE